MNLKELLCVAPVFRLNLEKQICTAPVFRGNEKLMCCAAISRENENGYVALRFSSENKMKICRVSGLVVGTAGR